MLPTRTLLPSYVTIRIPYKNKRRTSPKRLGSFGSRFSAADKLTRLCVQRDELFGIVPGPIGTRSGERLLVGDQDEHIDELALGKVGVEEGGELVSQVVSVPERPFRVCAVRLDVSLMVSFANLAEELL